jgi:acyl-coenzyme A synthetase/AMP-(fatty) acid ligase
VPWAFVVAADGRETDEVDPTALDALAREHLGPYKVPARYVLVDSLPRNEVGKVVASDLLALADER